MTTILKVPDIGDFSNVEIIEVLVKPGDVVAVEQSLITVESDKASMEIPATEAGRIVEMKVKLGDKVSKGSEIAVIEPAAGEGAAKAPAAAPAVAAPAATAAAPASASPAAAPAARPGPQAARAGPWFRGRGRAAGGALGPAARAGPGAGSEPGRPGRSRPGTGTGTRPARPHPLRPPHRATRAAPHGGRQRLGRKARGGRRRRPVADHRGRAGRRALHHRVLRRRTHHPARLVVELGPAAPTPPAHHRGQDR